MNDQVGVSVGDRGQHVKKQMDSRLDVQRALVTVDIRVLTIHVLKNKIRLSSR